MGRLYDYEDYQEKSLPQGLYQGGKSLVKAAGQRLDDTIEGGKALIQGINNIKNIPRFATDVVRFARDSRDAGGANDFAKNYGLGRALVRGTDSAPISNKNINALAAPSGLLTPYPTQSQNAEQQPQQQQQHQQPGEGRTSTTTTYRHTPQPRQLVMPRLGTEGGFVANMVDYSNGLAGAAETNYSNNLLAREKTLDNKTNESVAAVRESNARGANQLAQVNFHNSQTKALGEKPKAEGYQPPNALIGDIVKKEVESNSMMGDKALPYDPAKRFAQLQQDFYRQYQNSNGEAALANEVKAANGDATALTQIKQKALRMGVSPEVIAKYFAG